MRAESPRGAAAGRLSRSGGVRCERGHPGRSAEVIMRGHDQVITLLNDVLTAELTAVNQYFIHARMCEN